MTINEKLILETLESVVSNIAHLTNIQAGFAEILATKLPGLTLPQTMMLQDGSKLLQGLSSQLEAQKPLLQKAVADHAAALKAIRDLKVGEN